ncbi:SDR family NAD(P)-dependent oxidoreductase [Nocardioides sp. MAHUQ-72]|uniref:SDR family NAD(P)-dependent oxidoreductase n=1 Tax=unclassified Nocardioides TaxID=2615069 RepID=UPI00361CB1B4
MSITFHDKVALVTGAGSGIGRATAVALAGYGAKVAVAGRRTDLLAETVRLVEERGGEALAVPTDVADEQQVRAMVAATVERFGGLDLACNNAGIIGPTAPIVDLSPEDFDLTMSVNLRGAFLCLKHELTVMSGRGGGAVVNVSSVNAVMAEATAAGYCTSKAGLDMLTRVAALEHASQGIRVNSLRPGYVLTPMHDEALAAAGGDRGEVVAEIEGSVPMRRRAEPEEMAEAVAWLCSPLAAYVTGQTLTVDGGLAISAS